MKTTFGVRSAAIALLLNCALVSAQTDADQLRGHLRVGQKVSITRR
jgi:hypothetical protein